MSPTVHVDADGRRVDENGIPFVNPNAADPASGQVAHWVQVDPHNNVLLFRDISKGGEIVKLDLGVADVHVDRPLAAYATGFALEQRNLIADAVMPVVPVDKPSDQFYKWEKDDLFQEVPAIQTAAGGNIPEITPRHSTSPFATKQYAVRTFLPTEVEAAGDAGLQLGMRYLNLPMTKLLMSRELRVARKVTDAANYAAGFKYTTPAAEKWNGGASSDPVAAIHARMEASLMPITDIVMSERVYNAFSRNAQVQKYIASKTNVKPKPSADNAAELSAILELPPIHVGRQKYKSAASTYSYIWGNHVALYHLPSTMPPFGDAISWNTFRWKGGLADGINAREAAMLGSITFDSGWGVRTYYDQVRGAMGGKGCVVFHQDDEYFVEDSVSGLIIDAWQ
jgi:hypothetical protein